MVELTVTFKKRSKNLKKDNNVKHQSLKEEKKK